ncbi:MAG TPA: sensor histidine kinase [Candidatus Limnocylindria bacterium]|nr:sensor histidine kinase [Candidatus Limnocylindria bacterium]
MGRGRWAEPLMALVPIAMAVFTLVVLVEPGVQPAIVNLRLALAIDAVATLAAVAVAILGWVRYREGGDEAALWRASALLVLGTINALMATVTILGVETGFGLSVDDPGQLPLWASVITRGLAGGLLIVAGLVATGRRRKGVRRPLLVLWLPAMLVTAAVFIAAGIPESLPPLITPNGMTALRLDPVASLMPGAAPLLILVEALLALGYLYAAALSYEAFRRNARGTDGVLAVGLMLAAFSQVLFAIHPGTYSSLVTAGDLLRVAFYATLLATLAAEVRGDIRALRAANDELTRLRESEMVRAAAEERAHLARELHDGMSQELWYAKLKQGRLMALPEIVGTARELAGEVAGAIESALAEARQAILALRPAEGGSFAEVVQRYVADFSDRFGIAAECHCDAGADRFSPRAQAELLRIVQEALANVRKHADATLVRVELSETGQGLELRVTDNGRGFVTDQVGPAGYGLTSMQQRAAIIGGSLTIDSREQDGTRVLVQMPRAAEGG